MFGATASSWVAELSGELADGEALPAFLSCDTDEAFASAVPRGGMVPEGDQPAVTPEISPRPCAPSVATTPGPISCKDPQKPMPTASYMLSLVAVCLAIVVAWAWASAIQWL